MPANGRPIVKNWTQGRTIARRRRMSGTEGGGRYLSESKDVPLGQLRIKIRGFHPTKVGGGLLRAVVGCQDL